MRIAEVELPDGRIAEFEVSDDTTEEQVIAFANQQFGVKDNDVSPLWGFAKELAHSGKQALSGILEGAIGVVNLPGEAVRAVGEVAGVPSKYLPLSTAEINQRNVESGITAPPTDNLGDNIVRFAGGVTGGAAATPVKAVSATEQAMRQATDKLKAAPGVRAAANAGYQVPRRDIKQTVLNNLGERAGGKQAIEATARIKNQPITNELAAKALGLPKNTALTEGVIDDVISTAGQKYDVVSKIGQIRLDDAYKSSLQGIVKKYATASNDFAGAKLTGNEEEIKNFVEIMSKPEAISSKGAVEFIKSLRRAASENWLRSQSLSKAQREAADALEDVIERNIQPLGKKVMQEYRQARELIAKAYTIKTAFNAATGNVNAIQIAKQAGKKKLTGELKQMADFAKAFPKSAAEPFGSPASGGLFEPLVYGTASTALTGNPVAMAAAGIPLFGKPIARYASTATPSIGTNMPARELAARTTLGTSAFQTGR